MSTTNTTSPLDYIYDHGLYAQNPNFLISSQVSEDIELTATTILNYLYPATWNMVYAQDEEEFWQIWEETIAFCEDMGVQEVVDAYIEAHETALTGSHEYMVRLGAIEE